MMKAFKLKSQLVRNRKCRGAGLEEDQKVSLSRSDVGQDLLLDPAEIFNLEITMKTSFCLMMKRRVRRRSSDLRMRRVQIFLSCL